MEGAYQNPVHELTLILDCGFLYFITWQANVKLSAFKSFLIIVSMQYNIDVIKISDKIVNLIVLLYFQACQNLAILKVKDTESLCLILCC